MVEAVPSGVTIKLRRTLARSYRVLFCNNCALVSFMIIRKNHSLSEMPINDEMLFSKTLGHHCGT